MNNRRRSILDAAKKVFSENGYGAASMSHIATDAGGSKATLYSYFDNKRDLFDSYIEEECLRYVCGATAVVPTASGIFELLSSLGEEIISYIFSDSAIIFTGLIISESNRIPAAGEYFYNECLSVVIQKIAMIFQVRFVFDLGCKINCNKAAESFLGMFYGWAYFKRMLNVASPPSPVEAQLQAQEIASAFMRAWGLVESGLDMRNAEIDAADVRVGV